MSVNIKVILLTGGRNTKPSANSQWLRVTVRPRYVPEMRIGRGGCRSLDLYRSGQVLLMVLVFDPLGLSLRNGTRTSRVIQSLSVDLCRVLLFQLFQLLELIHRFEQQTGHRRYRRMGDIVGTW